MSLDRLSSPPSVARRPRPAETVRRRRIRQVGRAYTRFVTLLKVVLPALALGLLVLLAAWPYLRETAQAPALRDRSELEMLNARYVGADAESRPFTVNADRAMRSTANPEVMDLVRPQAEMTLEDGTWVTLRARSGHYNERTGQLDLSGEVDLIHDAGYEFRTDEAHVDVGAGNAWGDRPVTGQGPFGELFAQGFRLIDHGATIVFTGRAHLVLAGGAVDGGRP